LPEIKIPQTVFTQAQLDRYNEGRQFYADHLSLVSMYAPLPKADAYIGFTDAAVAGWLDAISDDIRTIQEMAATTAVFVKPDMLDHRGAGGELLGRISAYGPGSITDAATYGYHNISDFLPPGTQVKSPGGASFCLDDISGMDARGEPDGYLDIHLKGAGSIHFTFHRNVDSGPAAIYEIKRRIEDAIKRRKQEQEPQDKKYNEGWNAAIDAVMEASKKWGYHTGREEPPYHLPCLNADRMAELVQMKKRE
jgi:hypothetical protein